MFNPDTHVSSLELLERHPQAVREVARLILMNAADHVFRAVTDSTKPLAPADFEAVDLMDGIRAAL